MKRNIITILLAFFAIVGQAQIHYRIEGNIGHPEFTGIMYMQDVIKPQNIGTIEVVNGIITSAPSRDTRSAGLKNTKWYQATH